MESTTRRPPGRAPAPTRNPVIGYAIAALLAFGLTEALHHRLGEATIWELLNPVAGTGGLSDDTSGFSTVTEREFEIYVRVLEAMQSNRDVDVEAAAKSLDTTAEGFRDIERRVQRIGHLVERARDALREHAEALVDERLPPTPTS